METKKTYLILAIVAATLSVPLLAEVELPEPDERGLLAQAGPALAGIQQLYVAVTQPGPGPEKDGLILKNLQAKVKQKLIKAGISLYRGNVRGGPVTGTPQLGIHIDMIKLPELQKYVFNIRTSLARAVYLAAKSEVNLSSKPRWCIHADVWKKISPMQSVSVQNMPAIVTGAVMEHVEAFIHAYIPANPKPHQSPDATNISSAPNPRPKRAAKRPAAKYNYVASKNSKVFHRVDCASAKRISPKNLVVYNSKTQAIKGSKRPCKLCKP